MDCHIPKLREIPQGKWMCCECSAIMFKTKRRCGECNACLRRDDCGECATCKTKKRFGGSVIQGKQCELKRCKNKRYAAPENILTSSASNVRSTKKSSCSNKLVKKLLVKPSKGQLNGADYVASPFRPSSYPTANDGLNCTNIMIVRMKPSKKVSFFSQCFPDQIYRVESSLSDVIRPEKTVIYVSFFYPLLIMSTSHIC
jgi:hypothetical protein